MTTVRDLQDFARSSGFLVSRLYLRDVRRAEKVLFTQHMLAVCFHVFWNYEEIILSFSLRSANMGSFPETQNDPTLRLITGARAKNDAGY